MPGEDANSFAQQAADQIRGLIEEAERRAHDIVDRAEGEATAIRERAEAEAAERIAAVRRTLDDLGGKLGASAPAPAASEPAPPEAAPEPVAPDPVREEPAPAPAPDPPAPAPSSNGPDDSQAAKLVALNMALDGTSREDARAKLASDYSVADLDGLLDEVYSKVKN